MQMRRSSLLAFTAALAVASLGASPALAARPVGHRSLCPVLRSHPLGRPACGCPSGPIPVRQIVRPCGGFVSISGAVAIPTSLSDGELAAMPQTTFTIHLGRHHHRSVTATGVPLESLVQSAAPTLDPSIKNGLLRVTITVAGAHGQTTFGESELDPSFGHHPAYLAVAVAGRHLGAPALIVPGDRRPLREVRAVSTITVAIHNPTPTPSFTPGTLTVRRGSHARTLSARQLSALRSETLHVSFLAGTATTKATEVGPSLGAVLRAAHVRLGRDTWVAGVGDDGYVAVVTPAEQWVGRKRLQISLNENGSPLPEPRLVVDGDVKGGRYVSGLVDLVVGRGRPAGLPEPVLPQRRP